MLRLSTAYFSLKSVTGSIEFTRLVTCSVPNWARPRAIFATLQRPWRAAPKSLWRTLLELYTLHKIEDHCTVRSGPHTRPSCTERVFQARWKELYSPVELDEPVATMLPQHGDPLALRLMGQVHPLSARLGSVNQSLLPVTVQRPGGCLPRGWGQLDPTCHLLGQFRPLGPLPHGPLGVEHGQW